MDKTNGDLYEKCWKIIYEETGSRVIILESISDISEASIIFSESIRCTDSLRQIANEAPLWPVEFVSLSSIPTWCLYWGFLDQA